MEILSKGEGEKEERLASERDENRRQGGQRERHCAEERMKRVGKAKMARNMNQI